MGQGKIYYEGDRVGDRGDGWWQGLLKTVRSA